MKNQAQPQKRTSEIFQEVITTSEGDGDITIGEVLKLLGKKSFCLTILMFALPNCLPIPNIFAYSAITGVLIILLATQMIMGKNTLWLPSFIIELRFSRNKFINIIKRVLPYILKMENIFYPRMFLINTKATQKVVGIVFLLLGITLSLPIPFGNLLPGFAIAFIAIGFMERDGLMLTAGLLFGITSCILMLTAMKAILSAITRMF